MQDLKLPYSIYRSKVFFKFAEDLPRARTVLNVYEVLARDRTKDIGVDFSKESRLFAIVLHILMR